MIRNGFDESKNCSLQKPVAVFPDRLNRRMVLQSSMFTLHGGKQYDVETPPEDRLPEPQDGSSASPGTTLRAC